ncbi:helix-turn-helix transcriptional regulator [Streptomyces sp. NRRL B-24484]|uniref:helix-turn-helix transcriptional regulator n=1 Tax=Streptomyces sp. NRRL B-24484 TaxID=1463833 RepID=UPI0004C062E0|nr:helix-turn-helix transcriptional regulator [Streptomyces sp. NRRL B-24484]
MSLKPEVRRGGNLPFGMVANCWMCDPRYSTNARTLYGILVSYADTQARNTAMGHPYRRELARQLGASLSTLDRTLDEMEVAGMVTVEERPDPDNPSHHDANIYHLHDAGVLWQGATPWIDPLPPGVKAADIAKQRTEERRKAKREAGIQRRGGVPKGVSTKAMNKARTEGGSSTGAATPSSTGAARVAAPVLPYIYNPVHNPDRDASRTAEGQVTGGFARAREREQLAAPNGTTPGGYAASPRPKTIRTKPARPLPGEKEAYEILDALGLWERGRTPKMIRDRVRDLLKAGRTPRHVLNRVNTGWYRAQGPERLLLPEGDPYRIKRPVGFLATILEMGHDCELPDCELGVILSTGRECSACRFQEAERAARRAEAKIDADLKGDRPTESARH